MATYTDAIQKLYVAYFNRPADPAGLAYWDGAVSKANGDTSAVSAAFAASAEYKAAYANMDSAHVVNQVYQNLFGHGADAGGLNFWTQALANKQMTINDVVTQIASGAQGTDLSAYGFKVAFAKWFTGSLDTPDKVSRYMGDAANAIAKTLVASVIDQATLDQAIAGGPTATVLSNTPVPATSPFGTSDHTTQTSLDVSKLTTNYSTFELKGGSAITGVGSQSIVANGDITVTAGGYNNSGSDVVYAGTLAITEKATGNVTASADVLNLVVKASATADATATLLGDTHVANVTLLDTVDNATNPTNDRLATVALDTGNADASLKVLKLAGTGSANVINAAGSALTLVDASALGGKLAVAGTPTFGLNYTSSNAKAEVIKLGAGIDNVKLNASTYAAMDTVTGLNLVTNAKGSSLVFGSDAIHVGAAATFAKFTTTQTDLDLALMDAAAYAHTNNKPNLVFTLGGDTYVYQDVATPGHIDFGDVLVKITGAVNLDALILALGAPVS